MEKKLLLALGLSKAFRNILDMCCWEILCIEPVLAEMRKNRLIAFTLLLSLLSLGIKAKMEVMICLNECAVFTSNDQMTTYLSIEAYIAKRFRETAKISAPLGLWRQPSVCSKREMIAFC